MRAKFILFFIGLSVLSCKDETRKLPYYNTSDYTPVWELPDTDNFHKIPPFQLTDQEGKMFSEESLKGKIAVVNFFFTTCPGICPKMANSMSLLQKDFLNDNAVLLVSHSVTPDQDSVAILAKYAKKNKVVYNKWKLLTGPKEEIYNLGRKFYFVEEDLGENKESSIFLHTENFVLIDKNRMIRGIYNSLDPTSMASLNEDIKVLEKE
ncbi:SCO family protein [Flavobacterium muglaense]|uniref:SCO family protein n=1 Tax=Flavobacterium muglaense TaxID=2764716 RepID=A0A923N3B5_9FLAO|nr:SCO family protein [Flavobacterium muglaense]MBC5838355.1 SCO family protein [Flavobacterium muglaense]MBC5844868.1 SCO family protein [Flavobacterium muglaense]